MKRFTWKRSIGIVLAAVLFMGCLNIGELAYAWDGSRTARLSISYYLESRDGNMIAEPYIADMPKGSSYEVASPEIDNYVLKDQKQEVVSGVLNEDTEIAVVYSYDPSKEVQYKINYIGVNNKGQETILETVTEKAPVNTVISIPFKEFKGYDKRGGDMKLTVTSDGKAEKNVYYDKADRPYIIFNTNGSYIEPIMAEAGDDISDKIAGIEEPTRQGYAFAGWDKELPKIMPTEDYTVNAKWTPVETNYTVLYWFQNIEDDGYSLKGLKETRKALTGTEVTANEDDIANGTITDIDSPFYGFDYSHADTGTVKADGNGVVNVYYDREIWTINIYDNPLNQNMRYDDYVGLERKLWISVSGKYGSSTVGKMPTQKEIDARYSQIPFVGTDYEYVNLIIADKTDKFQEGYDGIGGINTFFTAGTFTIEGIENTHTVDLFPYYSSTPQRVFHFSIFGQSLNDLTQYELLQEKVAVGEAVATSFYLAPLKGFTNVDGYYRIDKKPVDEQEWISNEDPDGRFPPSERLEDGTYVFTVFQWNEFRQQRVKNTLTFSSNNETIKTVEDVYYETPLDEYLKLVPENGPENMKFAGWYLSPDYFNLFPSTTSYKMPETDLTFYAKWEPIDVTVSFDTQGGTKVDSQSVPNNGKATLPTEPIKDGYKFAGWYTSADGDDRWSFDRPVDKDTTLYAHWRPVLKTSYTVRHIMQGEEQPFFEETIDGGVGDTIIALPLDPKHAKYPKDVYLKADETSKTALLDKDAQKNILTFTYIEVAQKDYTVKYLNRLTNEPVAEQKTVTTKNTVVTEQAVEADDLKVYGNTSITQNIKENREIIFYYVPADLTVTYQFQSGTKGRELPEEVEVLLPADGGLYAYDDVVTPVSPATGRVEVTDGVWIFQGWDADRKTVTEDITFIGTWIFETNEETTDGQTTPAVPENPDSHGDEDGPGTPNTEVDSPKTGDSFNLLLWGTALILSLAVFAGAVLVKRKIRR